MVTVIGPRKDYNFGAELGQEIGKGISGYYEAENKSRDTLKHARKASALQEELTAKKAEAYSKRIDALTKDPLWKSMTDEEKQIALSKIASQHPEEAGSLQKYLEGIQKKKMETDEKIQIEQMKEEAKAGETEEDKQIYQTILAIGGKSVADLYKSSTEGGKTKILGALLDAKARGLDFNQILSQQGLASETEPKGPIAPSAQPPAPNLATPQAAPKGPVPNAGPVVGAALAGMPEANAQNPPQAQPAPIAAPQVPREQLVDYDKGLLPKERATRENERYNKNLPLFQESQSKLKAAEMEKEELGILKDLSPNVGFIERLNVNPATGDLIFPAIASPEAQRFVKTVNDFTRLAKDSYGARVTNFDLEQFMRRLPTLANSEEGRRAIIEQMQIINEINIAQEQSLHDVINEYGGVRYIDYDKAQQIADKRSKPIIADLKKGFGSISSHANKSWDKHVEAAKKKAKPDEVYVYNKKLKQYGYVPKNKLKQLGDKVEVQ